MDFEDLVVRGVAILLVLFAVALIIAVGWPFFLGNKGIDFVGTFNYADVAIGNSVKTYEIKKWTDYEGEQIQIWTKDGNVLLVSSLNTVLRKN